MRVFMNGKICKVDPGKFQPCLSFRIDNIFLIIKFRM